MSIAPDSSMKDKVCLVTGATSGLGFVIARELARKGARVVVIGRNAEKLRTSVEQIQRETGNPAVEPLTADLSSQADIRRLAGEIHEKYPHIDVLVNNAGAIFLDRRESPDGIELTLALNHLGYFLLTNLLLDILKASAPARIVNVSSDAHELAKFNFDDPQGKTKYNGMKAYGQSKLANLLFTFELARRLKGTGVTVNALHPGFVQTNFFAGNGRTGAFFRWANKYFGTPAELAARPAIYLASSPEVEGVTGQYYDWPRQRTRARHLAGSKAARDEAAAQRLWELSETLTGLKAAVPVS